MLTGENGLVKQIEESLLSFLNTVFLAQLHKGGRHYLGFEFLHVSVDCYAKSP